MTDYFEHIGDYKSGKLTGEALLAFEKELAVNQELKAAVSNHDVLDELLDLMWEEDVRKVMVEEKTEKKASFFRLRNMLLIAASILALIVCAWLIQSQLSNQHEKLYTEYYAPFIDVNVARGENNEPQELTPCNLGHFYMDEGRYEEAKEVFLSDLSKVNYDCTEKSQWYLSLYYLKFEQELERDELLEKIINSPDHVYYDKALKLRGEL